MGHLGWGASRKSGGGGIAPPLLAPSGYPPESASGRPGRVRQEGLAAKDQQEARFNRNFKFHTFFLVIKTISSNRGNGPLATLAKLSRDAYGTSILSVLFLVPMPIYGMDIA